MREHTFRETAALVGLLAAFFLSAAACRSAPDTPRAIRIALLGLLRAALAETGEYTGATGTIRFTGSPDPARSVVISRIHEGETSPSRFVDP